MHIATFASKAPPATAKKSFFAPQRKESRPLFFQPRLAIGPVDDVYEREADAVADRIMRVTDQDDFQPKVSPVHVQRKCAACEEEDKIQRKETRSGDALSTDDVIHEAIASPAQSLHNDTRQFMENRFGHDFSQVKIHTDTVAAKSAESINALAYTTGNHIVFNEGQYVPQSDTGQRLLAHELTHVVQQTSTPASYIQRLGPGDPSFEISDLPSYADERPDFVYFERNQSGIPASEIYKINEFAAANVNQPVINLYGYASEEGVAAENDLLVSERLNQVQTQLNTSLAAANGGVPYTGIINIVPRRSASHMQIDYRMFRSVEMATGTSTIGASSASVNTINCNTEQHAAIDTTRDSALTMVQEALTQVQVYRTAPATHPEVATTLDNNFHSHSAATVSTISGHLREMRTDLAGMNGNTRRRCASPQYNPCNNAGALTGRGVVTFCPGFFEADQEQNQVAMLLHEMGHYARFDADDRSYRFERVLPFLTTAEALDNSESIAIFILEMNDPTGARVESRLTTPATDTIAGCGTNRRMVEEALAWAERWNTYAYFGMSQTYSDWDNFLLMAPHITRRFGPVNRYTLAGMFDRYSRLMNLFEEDLSLECPSGTTGVCSLPVSLDTTTDVYTVCPAFFSSNLRNRIILLYAEVTRNVPEIRDDQRIAYAELARDFKIHFWGLPLT